MTVDEKKEIDKLNSDDHFYPNPKWDVNSRPNRRSKFCGYFNYGPEHENLNKIIENKIDIWLTDLNLKLKLVKSIKANPIKVAAWAQRSFVGIHPFQDGNGRVSRLIMDTILTAVGLPYPVIRNMSDDLFSTDEQWAKVIGQGILDTLEIFQNCHDNPVSLSCLSVDAEMRKNFLEKYPDLLESGRRETFLKDLPMSLENDE